MKRSYAHKYGCLDANFIDCTQMKKGLLLVFGLIFYCGISYGQTLKTGVLVIGNGSNAFGASFQSAISGVKTILLMETDDFELNLLNADDQNMLCSGLEATFLNKIRVANGLKDNSTLKIDPLRTNALLRSWADSTKNLSILRKKNWSKLKRSGRGWTVELSDGQTIKAEMLVYAGAVGKLNDLLLLTGTKALQWNRLKYDDPAYRTSVAAGLTMNQQRANFFSLYNLLIPGQEALIWLNSAQESIPGGQAAGATAAYPVFFKQKSSSPNLKLIQGELINHRLALMPFTDVSIADSNWKSIQLIGLSGFLKGTIVHGELKFSPELKVTTAEVKAPIKEYYYKAQIWFDDYQEPEMTIAATLDLVCKVGNKAPANTLAEVKKKWKSVYQFKTEFSPERMISRREFAVLVQEYLNPFNVNIDPTGRVIR